MANKPNPKARITFRTLASVYLMYLAYKMIRDWNQLPEGQRIGFGLAIAAFIIIPLFFLYTCWRDWKEIDAEEKAEQAEAAAEEARQALQKPKHEDDEITADERAKLELVERLASEGRVEELDELFGKKTDETK